MSAPTAGAARDTNGTMTGQEAAASVASGADESPPSIGGASAGIVAYRLLEAAARPSRRPGRCPNRDARAEELRAKLAETQVEYCPAGRGRLAGETRRRLHPPRAPRSTTCGVAQNGDLLLRGEPASAADAPA